MREPPATIGALRAAYSDGSLEPGEVVARAYERARAAGAPTWISLVPWEAVRGRVVRLRAARRDLPLYGIPFAIKDNVDLAGVPTTAACPAFAYTPERTAFVVDRLQAAGAVPIGKTNMDQFATGLAGTRTPYGPCSSVFDSRYVAGGSSSGSAVAVADGTVPFALGTDTAGSGRVPALMNGIVGLKPSRGALSTRGTVPACASLDCVSLFTGDVADASAVLEVAAARDRRDPWSRELRAPGGGPPGAAARIGVPGGPQLDFFGDRAAEAAWRGALARAGAAGWELVELDVDPFAEAAGLLYGGPWVAERFAAIGAFIAEHRREVDPVVAEVVLEGGLYTAAELFRAQHRLAELCAAIDPLWASLDALLMPTAPTLFTHAEVAERPRECVDVLGTYTNFANLLDLCAVAVPAGERADGLPFGVTLFGPAGADRRTLKLAARWETAMALAAGAYRAAPA